MTTETDQPPALSLAEELEARRAEQLQRLRYAQAQRDFPEFTKYCIVDTEEGRRPMQRWDHFYDPQYSPQNISLYDALQGTFNIIILKARQEGVTTFMLSWEIFQSQYGSLLPIQNFSQGETEAVEMLDKAKLMYDELPPELQEPLKREPTSTRIPWSRGSRMIAFPATKKGGRSFTSELAVFDENALHENSLKNFSAVDPQARQVVQISTANGGVVPAETDDPDADVDAGQFFATKFWRAWFGLSDDIAIFYPWWVRPQRPVKGPAGDDVMVDIHLPCECAGEGCGECEDRGYQINWDWYNTRRRTYTEDTEFLAEFPSTPQQAFGSKKGQVYDQFDDRVDVKGSHVVTVDPFKWEDAKTRWFGVDWGGGDPTAMGIYGVGASGHIHKFAEFHRTGAVPIQDMGEWLMEWHKKAPFFAGPCDPSQRNSIETLCAAGLPAIPADNARQNIGLVASVIKQKRLTIAARCIESRQEFPGYRWRDRVDPNDKNRYATSTPVDHHADHMDEMRYVVTTILHIEHGRRSGQVSTINGQPRAKKAV